MLTGFWVSKLQEDDMKHKENGLSKHRRQVSRLDKLWSRAIIKRDNQTCQKCFKFGDNPHHIIPRRYLATRHALDNGLTLCTKCHSEEAHGNPEAFGWWFENTFPGRWKRVNILKNNIKPDLDKIEAELKEIT